MNRRILTVLAAMTAIAAAPPAARAQEGEMPPMGPPEELQKMAPAIGTWDVEFQYKLDPAAEWQTTSAVATISWALDECATRMDYDGTMMGMPFKGVSYTTYDRELDRWTEMWIDNLSARMSVYHGGWEDGKFVTQGEDYAQGQKMLVRNTVWDHSATGWKWKMEMSMDGGESWMTWAKATYSKQD